MTHASVHRKPGLAPILGAALCAALPHPAAAQAPAYTITDLGTFGSGTQSIAQGLNNTGQTVGTSNLSGDATGHGFLYQYTPSSPPPGLPTVNLLADLFPGDPNKSDADAINNSGIIVGYNGSHHAFAGTPGSLTDLGTFGGAASTAFGINSASMVVGGAETATTDSMGNPNGLAFRATPGPTLQPLGVLPGYDDSSAYAVNASGNIVGSSFNFMGILSQATLFSTSGSPVPLGKLSSGGLTSDAYGVNNSFAVGDAAASDGSLHPVEFTLSANGSVMDLGLLPTFNGGVANGINSGIGPSGPPVTTGNAVVGNMTDISGGTLLARTGFLYIPGSPGALYDLNNLRSPNSMNDRVQEAFSINDYGQIAGDGLVTGGALHGFLLSPTTTVTGLSPTTVAPNTSGFTLVVTGTNFAPNAVVYYNGIPEPTTFNSITQVTATIGNSGSAGSATVDVGTPTPGGNYQVLQVAAPTTVSGTITLQGYQGTETGLPVPTLTFVLTPNGATPGGPITATFQPMPVASPPNSQFTYTLTGVPAGTYTLGVKGPIWEREDAAVNTTGGSQAGVNITLPAGDVNNDNHVDGTDFALLSAAFGTNVGDANFNQNADLNGDGHVDGTDFALLSGNYGTSGQPF